MKFLIEEMVAILDAERKGVCLRHTVAFYHALMKFLAKYGRFPGIRNIIIVQHGYPLLIEYECYEMFCYDFAEMFNDELLEHGLAARLNVENGKHKWLIYNAKL